MSVPNLLLVGCGKMGGALLSRLSPNDFGQIVVVDPNFVTQPRQSTVIVVTAPDKIPDTFTPSLIILAVKPQMMAAALPAYNRYPSAVFLSIAAGITLAKISDYLNLPQASIIRSMPNLPASIGLGATGVVANNFVSTTQKELCTHILSLFGIVEWLTQEDSLDAITALSGSGPAYIFALCEVMASAGVKLGLSQDLAERLARQTVIGSASLLAQSQDTPATLRHNVTSPNGTTAAALQELIGNEALQRLMDRTMAAAAQRSSELAK